jgi:SRSO17 transposase
VDLQDGGGTGARFRVYAADVTSVLGHADRVEPFEAYCVGLLTAEGRKSVEPLAAVTRRSELRRSTSRCCTWWRMRRGPIGRC